MPHHSKEIFMRYLAPVVIALSVFSVTVLPGCAVSRDQSSVGSYIDDAAITTAVKARFAEDKTVAATSISVETLNGTVLLSGFAKNATEKMNAEKLAHGVKGVKSVKNEIVLGK
jgi:hyperosmotically inducible periplasmic protein